MVLTLGLKTSEPNSKPSFESLVVLFWNLYMKTLNKCPLTVLNLDKEFKPEFEMRLTTVGLQVHGLKNVASLYKYYY